MYQYHWIIFQSNESLKIKKRVCFLIYFCAPRISQDETLHNVQLYRHYRISSYLLGDFSNQTPQTLGILLSSSEPTHVSICWKLKEKVSKIHRFFTKFFHEINPFTDGFRKNFLTLSPNVTVTQCTTRDIVLLRIFSVTFNIKLLWVWHITNSFELFRALRSFDIQKYPFDIQCNGLWASCYDLWTKKETFEKNEWSTNWMFYHGGNEFICVSINFRVFHENSSEKETVLGRLLMFITSSSESSWSERTCAPNFNLEKNITL